MVVGGGEGFDFGGGEEVHVDGGKVVIGGEGGKVIGDGIADVGLFGVGGDVWVD